MDSSIFKYSYFKISIPGIDFFFGLPLSENHRAARLVDDVFNVKNLLTAKRYWPIIWTFFTQPNSICKRSIVNPPEYDKVNMNV